MTGATTAGQAAVGFQECVDLLGRKEGWRVAYARLNNAGHAALVDVLDGLAHRDRGVRKWCAALLDHHADERCAAGLVRALSDPAADVRRHAVHAIGCQSCKTSPLPLDVVALLIERASRDTSVRVRRSAAHLLGLQPADARAAQALRTILATEPDAKVRRNAQWALAHHADAPNPAPPSIGR
jgi:HEAT repeat protein